MLLAIARLEESDTLVELIFEVVLQDMSSTQASNNFFINKIFIYKGG